MVGNRWRMGVMGGGGKQRGFWGEIGGTGQGGKELLVRGVFSEGNVGIGLSGKGGIWGVMRIGRWVG